MCTLLNFISLFQATAVFGVVLAKCIFFMKYFNKTRTIEDKVNDRDLLRTLQEQNHLLKQILVCLEGNQKAE